MSINAASRTYHIARETIRLWLKAPTGSLSLTRTGRSPYDIEVKVQALRLLEDGSLSIRQVADYMRIQPTTIYGWVKDKHSILAVYSSQEQRCVNASQVKSSGEETKSMGAADDKDTKQHIKDLKDENEFLKAKVAYLEALMELNGTPVSGFKKNSIPGHRQSPRTRNRKSEPPLPRCRYIQEELLLPPQASIRGFRYGDPGYDP